MSAQTDIVHAYQRADKAIPVLDDYFPVDIYRMMVETQVTVPGFPQITDPVLKARKKTVEMLLGLKGIITCLLHFFAYGPKELRTT